MLSQIRTIVNYLALANKFSDFPENGADLPRLGRQNARFSPNRRAPPAEYCVPSGHAGAEFLC